MVVGVPWSSHRYQAREPDEESPLIQRMTELALLYGRYGYRRITVLLRNEGWHVHHKRIERLWKKDGLKVKKASAEARAFMAWVMGLVFDFVMSYDFVHDRTRDGRAFLDARDPG